MNFIRVLIVDGLSNTLIILFNKSCKFKKVNKKTIKSFLPLSVNTIYGNNFVTNFAVALGNGSLLKPISFK